VKRKCQPKLDHQIKIYRTMRGRRPPRMLFVKHNTYVTLSEKMESMAKGVKNLPMDPSDIADRIMKEVEHFEDTWVRVFDETRMSDSLDAIMDQMFEKMSVLEPEQRMETMRQMMYVFTLHSDQKIQYLLDDGWNEIDLYREKYQKLLIDRYKSEEALQKDLKNVVNHNHISPLRVNWMKEKVLDEIPYVATAAAFGKGSYELKCITAMDLYLNSLGTREEMSPELAAVNTCMCVDLEAIADGARMGGCFESTAVVLMWILLIVASLCVDALIVVSLVTGGPLAFLVAIGGYLGLEILYKLGDCFARLMGNLGVRYASMLKKGNDDMREGLHAMYENLMESQRDEFVMEDDTGEIWNEVTETAWEV